MVNRDRSGRAGGSQLVERRSIHKHKASSSSGDVASIISGGSSCGGGSSRGGVEHDNNNNKDDSLILLSDDEVDEHQLLLVDDGSDHDEQKEHHKSRHSRRRRRRPTTGSIIMSGRRCFSCMNSTRWMVLLVLCLQNSLFTVLRRYSQGVLLETYSKYECLLLGEVIKMIFSAWMIRRGLQEQRQQHIDNSSEKTNSPSKEQQHQVMTLRNRLVYLVQTCKKMIVLALIYGAMNILSFVSLRNIGAGLFTIFAQAKIFTTALFSTIILGRKYNFTKWRALISLVLGVLLFSEPVWGDSSKLYSNNPDAKPMLGTAAVLIEVSLSGFASIYFEKAIKTDPLQLTIWERNFQLSLGSFPVYLAFIVADGGGIAGGLGRGWSILAVLVSVLGAAGGMLVALSIKYGDSILKTLATTGAIVLSSFLDYWFLNGPLTPTMVIACGQVILSICNYTFDASPPDTAVDKTPATFSQASSKGEGLDTKMSDEEAPLVTSPGSAIDNNKG